MAVSYISAESVSTNSTANGSQSITIPSDAEAVIYCVAGFQNNAASYLDELDFDDTSVMDFTEVLTQPYTYLGDTDDAACAIYIMTDTDANWPGTGAQTIYYSTTDPVQEGNLAVVVYVKGLDKSNPIRDTDSQEGSDSGYGSGWTSSLSGVAAGDLTLIVSYHFGTGLDVNPGGSGQTLIVESSVFNSAMIGVAYEAGESAAEVDGTYRVPIAFAIREAAGGATNPKGPLCHPLRGPLGGPI